MPLAHVGAVLSLLGGPSGCAPGFYVVWCRFKLLRRYVACNPLRFGGFSTSWSWLLEGVLCMDLHIFLVDGAGVLAILDA